MNRFRRRASAVAMKATVYVKQYVLPMAYRAYGMGALDPDVDRAKKVLAYFKKHEWHSFTSPKMIQAGICSMKKKKEIELVLEVLENAGWILPPVIDGRKTTYTVNAILFED